GAGNVSSRPTTSRSVTWAPVPWTSVGAQGVDQRTSDLSKVVSQIVHRPGWASGQSMAIILTGPGRRVAVSHDGSAAGAPVLHVEYAQPAPVAVGEGPGPELAPLRVSPTPARGPLRVEFGLVDDTPAVLELIDVAGRRVAAREVGRLGAGRHQVRL